MIPFFDLEGGFLTDNELLFLAGASGGGVAHTIINNPATFTTDLAKPLKRLLIPFTPVQTGTGTPAPDNVRPITGWTGLNINRTGKNLFDKATGIELQTSAIRVARNVGRGVPFHLKKGVTYTFSTNSNTMPDEITLQVPYSATSIVTIYSTNSLTYAPTADVDVALLFYWENGRPESATDIMIELGATATGYEPYTGTTIPVSWASDAGTVYGGTLDALTGVLTVGWSCITDAGTAELWSMSEVSGFKRVAISKDKFPNAPKNNSTENLFVNYMKASNWSAAEWQAFIGSTGNFLAYVDATTCPDKDAWLAYLAEHPIQICYELETPFTVQLDPVALSTLKGDNVIWTDTNGDNTITYIKRT